ncbi:MAG: M20 family metallopeptidase, partial [Planctomycetaceae bacterium]
MRIDEQLLETLRNAVDTERLTETATQLLAVPSPTRNAAAAADRLQDILESDGFDVERPEGGWADAPAVAARLNSGKPGKTLQFNGHLDTVHLPFVPPRVEDGILSGSGAIDMKGGVAAMVEALRVVRETGALQAGEVLLTAHDLHEAPWGDGSQLEGLIESGYAGDAVLLPEYTCDFLPVIGRGLAVLEVKVTRAGGPVHEVMGGLEQPNVIAVGCDVARRLSELHERLASKTHPSGLRETAFVGQIHAGEIYNQSPVKLQLSGTRRWLPETDSDDVRREFFELLSQAEQGTETQVEGEFFFVRGA